MSRPYTTRAGGWRFGTSISAPADDRVNEPGPKDEIWVVDRMEGDVAVMAADHGEVLDVARELLPEGAREGSVLRVVVGPEGPNWREAEIDETLREDRLREAREILERLKKRDPGGDIKL